MPEVLPEEPQQNGTTTQSTTHESENHTASYPTKQRRPSVDRDAQDMVIDSLRSQIQDLISQVSQLNNKLVKSYDRVSDLEDDLHVASANVRSSSLKISQLELERTQHLAALNTGLLVEKSHVTAELTRLMEKATEEAAQRGQAESARLAIEKDLDDLSASLFGQANSMVAEARYDKHLSERKVEDAERALKSAEEAVQLMQAQMQAMQAEKEEAEQKTREMEVVMGKGKWIDRQNGEKTISLRLLSTHSPYQEYLAFIAHLRILHPTSPNPPAMSTLLQLPFLTRLMTEDSEPTVRLDIAPSLNWLSRRSVLAAIHSGQLTIEPMSSATLFAETTVHPTSTTIAGINSSNDNVACALCGVPIFPTLDPHNSSRPPIHPQSHIYQPQPTSWSGAFFKKANGSNTAPSSPTAPSFRNNFGSHSNSQIFIFRLAAPSTSIASLPIPTLTKASSQPNSSPIPSAYASSSSNGIISQSHSQSGSQSGQPTTIYPLCMSGWCLHRLRTTCTLWAFVRTGIVDKIWEEELPPPPPPPSAHPEKSANGDKPPVPPRKRGLWGIASAFGERAASWGEGDRDKSKRNSGSASSSPAQPELRRLPPPPPPVSAARPSPVPPPLPKRNEGRVRTPVSDPPPPTPPRASVEKPTADVHPESSNTEAPVVVAATSSPRVSADLPPIPPRRSREAPPPSHSEPSSDAAAPATPPPRPPRAHTPVSVPLPESRPASPAVPSRTASPANVAVAAAGGPPPPLPRRAAARTRTHLDESMSATAINSGVAESSVSVSEPASIAADKTASNAELSATEEVKEGEKTVNEVVAETSVESEAAKGKTASSDPVSPAESPVATEGAAVRKEDETVKSAYSEIEKKTDESPSDPDRSTQPSPASDEFVDAPTPGDEAEDPLETATPVKNQEKEKVDGDKEVAVAPANGVEKLQEENEDDKQTIIDSPATVVHPPLPVDETESAEVAEPAVHASANEKEVIEGEAAGVQDKAEVNDDAPPVPTLAIPEKTPEEKLEEERRRREKEEWEKANYVGEATWEERTWKEIVRLREDMFWARVGGIRE
ncbi:hypothetical protein JR316_0008794 [Psilocybe cubensis]|uniref:GDP/GTP exchange factor Sec2 N-terminal domain-containing protein n=2 Tax=Psilocybe cubensis TaxID=181762 RepID=A0A8H7XYK4_PSICU|nr:hypothetical protein JR316_0008794 [Psilocybe cubensis]KAH9478340.1 hypothetical protein JR316_0008794 [Psilocybe cubensis]